MKSCLIVIDMQNDFIDGSLGTAEAEHILPAAVKKASEFDGEVCFTRDMHGEDYLKTHEGILLPVKHCIRGTQGAELNTELKKICEERGCTVYDKNTFASIVLAEEMRDKYLSGKITNIELIGLCTDICVVSNALILRAYMPEAEISVDSSCCAGTTVEKHIAALRTMESCQIKVY